MCQKKEKMIKLWVDEEEAELNEEENYDIFIEILFIASLKKKQRKML